MRPFIAQSKRKDPQLFYYLIHPWAVLGLLLPALLSQCPQGVRETGVSRSFWTLPDDNARYGCGHNRIMEWNVAGEDLHQRVRLFDMKRIHHLPQS